MKIKNIIAISLVTSFLLFGIAQVRAAATDTLFGNAWSSNIGWISSNNCTNIATCTGSDYGVVVNQATGAMTGYMWSSNIGWISFAGARVDFVNKNSDGSLPVRGWAQACSVFVTGCSGTLVTDFYRGGWDGRIALSSKDGGGTPVWGWQINANQTITGDAWGSDIVGWVEPADLTVNFSQKPTVLLFAAPATINPGMSSVLTWYSGYVTSCSSTDFDPAGKTKGTLSVSPTATKLYTISCIGLDGSTVSANATVTVVPATPDTPPPTTPGPTPPPTNPPSGITDPGSGGPGGGSTCTAPNVIDPVTGACVKGKVKIIYKEI